MSELEGVSYFIDRRRVREPRARLPDALRPEHQRGMRSFLTWSFLLAQVALAEQMAGSAAAAAATEPGPSGGALADGATSAGAVAGDALHDIASDAESELPAAQGLAATGGAANSEARAVSDHGDRDVSSASAPAGAAASAGSPHGVGSGPIEGSDSVGTPAATEQDLSSPPLVVGEGIDVGLSVDLGIDIGLEDSVVLDLSTPVLDIGLEVRLDLDVLPAGDSVATLVTGAGDLIRPVLDTVGDVASAATGTLASVTGAVGLDGLLGGLPLELDGIVASSGSIQLPMTAGIDLAAPDVLFDGPTYTDLNITLQSILPGQSPVPASVDPVAGTSAVASLIDSVIPAAADSDSSAAPADIPGGMAAALGLEDAVGSNRTLADLFG